MSETNRVAEGTGAPKPGLSPEAVAFRDSLLKHGARESAEVDGLLMSDFLDFAARLFDAHRVNAHASLVAQIQRKDEALKAAGEKFREYEALHQKKLNDAPPDFSTEEPLRQKVARNREMAEMCEAAQEGEI